jgi:hypothetical protein
MPAADPVVRDLGAPTLLVHNIDGRVPSIFRKGIAEVDPAMALDTLRNSAFSAFLVGQQAARLMRDNKINTSGLCWSLRTKIRETSIMKAFVVEQSRLAVWRHAKSRAAGR